MYNRLRELILGSPLPTSKLMEKRLDKIRALAAFSPDALSSIAYANQEIYLGLAIAGAAGLSYSFPISIAIVVLLSIVALSYSQTIMAYPSGGGSYVVAKENLGTLPGLLAAAALLIDYVLTAAVSLTAGVEAIASAFPVLWNYRIETALGILVILTLLNLRGLQETGSFMSVPVYLFLFTYIPMLIYGIIRLSIEGPTPLEMTAPPALQPLSTMLLLHAFATGCTALTGIESISNGVPVFKPPESDNARKTLIIMALLMGLLFAGSIGLTQGFGVIARNNETILSALSRHIFGNNIGYYIIQISTLLILAVAANTSFAGFPRLAAVLAKDKFLPHQMSNLGDRLVYTYGILLLSLAAAILILIFGGKSHALIPLFAVGAFLAFTLSQLGMVRHWHRRKERGWQAKSFVNLIGAIVTAIALIIIGVSKFLDGAWISVVIIPFIILLLFQIRSHYRKVGKQLSLHGLPPSLKPLPSPRIVLPVSGVHQGIVEAMNFAQSLSSNITAVFIELDPGTAEEINKEWQEWWPDVPLDIVASPYRSIVFPLLEYLDKTDIDHNDGQQAVLLLPEFIPARWWQSFLHNQSAWLIRLALLYRKRKKGYQRVVIEIPFHLRD
ncbi:MAG: APC family permease [Anaerolineaceae bacterium]